VLSLITVGIIIGEQTVSTFTSKYLSAISAMSLNNAIIDFMKKTINTIAVIIVPTEPYEAPDIAPANLSTKTSQNRWLMFVPQANTYQILTERLFYRC
jgi:hypothetical protein